MKTGPAPDRTPLRGVAVKLAIKRSSLTRSPLTSSSRHRRRDLRSSDSCSLEPPSTARLFPGAAYSRLALFYRVSESPPKKRFTYGIKFCSYGPPEDFRVSNNRSSTKLLQLITGCSSTYNLTTNQRAPRSQKWAGAEVTLRIAWIKSPILPGVRLTDPPTVGSSKQFPEAAVVAGGWN